MSSFMKSNQSCKLAFYIFFIRSSMYHVLMHHKCNEMKHRKLIWPENLLYKSKAKYLLDVPQTKIQATD